MRKRLLMITVLFTAHCASAGAAELETLLMPGPVGAAHAKIERECGQCHDRRDRSRQPQLCLACHENVGADLQQRRGFHGRAKNVSASQCSACHSEHRGRDADIVKLSAERFDHDATDFPLQDHHVGVPCAQCHTGTKPYRDAPAECVACHAERDPHGGKLGRQCDSCHSASGWPATRFDHAKTKFPLTGSHDDLACGACHAGNRYADTPRQCVSCHAADDVHAGARGPSCGNCHDTAGWRSAKFDHAKETGFALLGAHSRTDCLGCHRSGDMQKELPRTCAGCHAADDAHATRLGASCESCHASEAWLPSSFDHLRDARYRLTGAHAGLSCHRCHTANAHDQKLGRECVSCHQVDDVHGATAGASCAQCHGEDSWRSAPGFDHDLTSFPLLGLHLAVPCAGCHADHRFAETRSDCKSCHAKQDVHAGKLGASCSECHTANGWNLWEFDHSRTHFPLTGAHEPLQCTQCHRDRAGKISLSTSCASCHGQDDIHLGQFGTQCQQCHLTSTFKGAIRRPASPP